MSKRAFRSVWPVLAALALGGGAIQAHAACQIARIAELPVTLTDLQPLAATKINGADATFLVDSGAFYSQITPSKAAEFGLKLGPAPYGLQVRGVGGYEQVSVTTVREFTIVGESIDNLQFLVGGGEAGHDTAGALGRNFLGLADAEYDLANGVVRLVKPIGCGGQPLVYWPSTSAFATLKLEESPLAHPPIRADVFVNGARIKAMFDSGAGHSTLSLEAAKRAGIDIKGPNVVSAGLIHGVGRRAAASWIVPVDSFKVGDEEVNHTRMRVADTDLPDVDLLLGADFFLSHHIYVANGQHRIYLTYNGGPVFNLDVRSAGPGSGAAVAAGPAPKPSSSPSTAPTAAQTGDAAALARQGEALASRHQLAEAIDALTRAVALAPDEPAYRFARAAAYDENRQPALALADLDKGLLFSPADIPALMRRARLRIAGPEKARALADLDAADRLAAPQSDARFGLAELYSFAEAYPRALTQLDLWIAAHPDDSRLPGAIAMRCRARAVSGDSLDRALADCNQVLKASPRNVAILNDRGLVLYRQGAYDKAAADFEMALAITPKDAWALYGRGLARIHQGRRGEGDADIAAAKAINPTLVEKATALGLTP